MFVSMFNNYVETLFVSLPEQLGLTPLLDNDPRDRYYYEIIVSTGMRRGAGTESKVFAIMLRYFMAIKRIKQKWDKLF